MKALIQDFLIYLSSERGLAKNTLKAYESDLLSFEVFLRGKAMATLGKADLIAFLFVALLLQSSCFFDF